MISANLLSLNDIDGVQHNLKQYSKWKITEQIITILLADLRQIQSKKTYHFNCSGRKSNPLRYFKVYTKQTMYVLLTVL